MGIYFQTDFNSFYGGSLNFNQEILFLVHWQITHLSFFLQIITEQERGYG